MFILSVLKTFIFIILLTYFIFGCTGLRCCVGFPPVEVRWGCSLVLVHGLLIAAASLAVEHESLARGL